MEGRRKIIEIDEERCDGCGQCVVKCAEGAVEIIDGKAKLIRDSFCDGLGACLGECPRGALKIVEREAPEFDPEAVERHLEEREKRRSAVEPAMACGCPSSQIRVFPGHASNPPNSAEPGNALPSVLAHWPVQLRLVPPQAPFLKDADLLVVADCVPVAHPDFHRKFVAGKVVLLGCPKFDNAAEYVQKFEQIFRTANIRSVTVLDMEVPCCSAMPVIVKKGMGAAGKSVPMEEIVVSVRGEVLKRNGKAA